jgi:hypothetical protein
LKTKNETVLQKGTKTRKRTKPKLKKKIKTSWAGQQKPKNPQRNETNKRKKNWQLGGGVAALLASRHEQDLRNSFGRPSLHLPKQKEPGWGPRRRLFLPT